MPISDQHTLSPRQRQLLAAVVETYVQTCAPVGSKMLAGNSLDVSPATIRNDMAELEAAGLLTQPHTSAGRLPTAAGYRYYIERALGNYRMTATERRALQAVPASDPRQTVKTMAKALAELSESCVVVGFSPHDVYYTGIANLFAQPEFRDYQFGFSMTEVIDHLDEVMERLFVLTTGNDDVQILIGERNPFGENCSALLTRFLGAGEPGLMGVLGPLRMRYARNRELLFHTCRAVSA